MFAHDPSSLQEAEIAEVEPFAEAVYNGYAEAEPFAGYGEFYPQQYPPRQYPQQQSFMQSMIPQIRMHWSPQFGRMMPHRWDMMMRRWVPAHGGGGGPPPGWHQGGTPPHRRVYLRCSVWPGPPGLVPINAGAPGMPGMPGGMPGMPGMPMPGMPGAGGGGGRRRRRRRR